ncbi:uncharacterized protein LOC118645396 isoform X2 [Monomorium pharaonis]|uniref:uncharacterized protein LOC118645396 isoform X2 n=1 Tax=Monomorium pharaonis TaxID=307658 RepID=UPI001745D43A|nr:uncharacterized protein LOC118645396 isoform X2 [Monomorium pharaonis]
MPSQLLLKFQVTLVRNPSLTIERTMITLKNKQFPEINELFVKIEALCHKQPFRIYWRVSEQEYMPIYNFISLKGGLNLMYTPGIYVVMDEPVEVVQYKGQLLVQQNHDSRNGNKIDASYDLEILLHSLNTSMYKMNDIEVLQRALLRIQLSDDPRVTFNHFVAKTSIPYTCEWKEVDRQLEILMKGFSLTKR